MRNDLNRLAQILAATLFGNDAAVDSPRRPVAVSRKRRMRESLVMAKVEVGLAPVVQNVDLAVLVRTHRARIDVNVGVKLLHPDRKPAVLQQHADRRARQPLAKRTHDAAGDKNMLRHNLTSIIGRDADKRRTRRS